MDRLYENEPFLRFICRTNPAQRKQVLTSATKEQVNCLCECAYNVLKRNVPLTPQETEKLRKYRAVVYKLVDKRVPLGEKKRLLVQQSGGLLPALVPPILGTVLGVILDQVFRG
jgi:hypothetical protein